MNDLLLKEQETILAVIQYKHYQKTKKKRRGGGVKGGEKNKDNFP